MSSVSIGEIVYGIERLPKSRKRRELETWLAGLQRSYGDRILPFDTETARLWGEISAACEANGKTLPQIDGQIAATALPYGLHLMTGNTGDFAETGCN